MTYLLIFAIVVLALALIHNLKPVEEKPRYVSGEYRLCSNMDAIMYQWLCSACGAETVVEYVTREAMHENLERYGNRFPFMPVWNHHLICPHCGTTHKPIVPSEDRPFQERAA